MAMRQLKIEPSITKREEVWIQTYLTEIRKIPVLSDEEEVELAKKAKAGDQKAIDKLVQSNLRFVVSVAKKYQGQGLLLADLINEGNMGLIKAARRFDHTRGLQFISYAVWWIRQGILQALAEDSRLVRLPLNKIGEKNRMGDHSQIFLQKYEREPSIEELAEIMEEKEDTIKSIFSANAPVSSLDHPLGDRNDNTLLDVVASPEESDAELNSESTKSTLLDFLRCLTQRQSEVITYFFGLDGNAPLSLEAIGDKYDLTRERIRQIKDRGIMKLKLNRSILAKFL